MPGRDQHLKPTLLQEPEQDQRASRAAQGRPEQGQPRAPTGWWSADKPPAPSQRSCNGYAALGRRMGAAPGLPSARCGFAAVAAFFSLQSPTRQVVPQVRRSDRDRSSSGASQRRHRPVFIAQAEGLAQTERPAQPLGRDRTSHRARLRADPRMEGTRRSQRGLARRGPSNHGDGDHRHAGVETRRRATRFPERG